jgi:hypothetical protein
MTTTSLLEKTGFEGYGTTEKPLASYAALLAGYSLTLGGFLWATSATGRLPDRLPLRDLALVGAATHKLTKIIARDWVTVPLRAPVTEFKGTKGGDVVESSRGRGLRRALGDLLRCQFCMGPWVAGTLMCGMVVAPRQTRFIAGLFSAVAVSDFLHQAYAKARKEA